MNGKILKCLLMDRRYIDWIVWPRTGPIFALLWSTPLLAWDLLGTCDRGRGSVSCSCEKAMMKDGKFLTRLAPVSFTIMITRRILCCFKIFYREYSSDEIWSQVPYNYLHNIRLIALNGFVDASFLLWKGRVVRDKEWKARARDLP